MTLFFSNSVVLGISTIQLPGLIPQVPKCPLGATPTRILPAVVQGLLLWLDPWSGGLGIVLLLKPPGPPLPLSLLPCHQETGSAWPLSPVSS